MDSQLALAAFQFDRALVLVDGGGYQFHECRRHRFARYRVGCSHSPFQLSAIQVKCGRYRVDAIPAGQFYRRRPQRLGYSLLAAPTLPPAFKAGACFIEIESID
jgi:hypothetical protein